MSPFIPTETTPSEALSNVPVPEAFNSLWQPLLFHSTGGIVGLVAVRDTKQVDKPIVDFQYQFLNEVARRDTRTQQPDSTEPIIGALLSDFFPSIRQTTLWTTYLDVISTGQPRRVEQHYQIGKRDIQVVQSVAPTGTDGLLLTYADSSDLQLLTRRLAHQTILLNGVLNSSPNAILVFDAIRDTQQEITDFQLTLTNRQGLQLTGLSDAQMLGYPLSLLYPLTPDQLDRLRQLVQTGGSLVVDQYVPHRTCWLSISITMLNDSFVATVQDVSADRQMRRQLEQTVQELHQSNQSLEQFAYIASHDLQEPLRKITAFSSILTSQYAEQLDINGQTVITRMQLAAERMSALIRDLLAYARIGNQHTSFRAIDLTQLVRDLLDDMEITIQASGATVKVEPLPQLCGDPVQLRQLMQNLLSNALKFKRDDRPPVVQISSEQIPVCQLPATLLDSVRATHAYWLIRVTDNGIGFAPEYYDRIFEVFQRLHGRSQYSGTGIGLAIVRKVAEQHGGLVVVDSEPNVGSTFSIYLPVIE